MWEDNNARLLDEIPAVIGLFAPIDDDGKHGHCGVYS
jgi:hypothetical protein